MKPKQAIEIDVLDKGIVPPDLVDAAVPVILRGFVAHWPVVAAAKQSHEAFCQYMSRFLTQLPVVVYRGIEGINGKIGYKEDFSGFNFQRESSTLAEVLNQLCQPMKNTLYIGSTRVDRWLPGFREQNDLVFNGQRPVVNFWLGNQNKVSAHNDSPDNIACCVAGKRRFTLFPPDQIENLYIGPVDITPSGRAISLVDFELPDFDKFPRFRNAIDNAMVVDLEPGDAVYIPPLWWHHVQSRADINMLVNYWWQRVPEYRGIPDLALEHAILALRGLPESQRQAWKVLFDYYVFGPPDVALQHIPANIKGMLNDEDERAIRLGWINLVKKLNS